MEQQFSEWIAPYSLDQLTEADVAQIGVELTDPAVEQELADFRMTVAAIAYGAPAVAMASDLKDRLMQRIAASPSVSTVETLKQKAETVEWQTYSLTPQTQLGTLLVNKETREVQCFVRAHGAVQFPHHRHAQSEEIVVLEDDLEIDGRVYHSGEQVNSEPGSEHRPATREGGLLFLRASLDDEILD